MDKYYYFVAQLPFLEFGKPLSITREWFLTEAEKWLNKKDFQILHDVNINDFVVKNQDSKLLKQYKRFEYNIRYELSKLRKARKKGEKYKISALFSKIISENNPLEIERKLLYLRWKFIEEIELGHYFDLEYVVSFYLKMQILERFFSFDKEKGKQKFESLSGVIG